MTDDQNEIIRLLSKEIAASFHVAAGEQYAPSFDADASDEKIKERKEQATKLREIRNRLEEIWTGVL